MTTLYAVVENVQKEAKAKCVLSEQAKHLAVGQSLFVPASDPLAQTSKNGRVKAQKLRARQQYLRKTTGKAFSVFAGSHDATDGFFLRREQS